MTITRRNFIAATGATSTALLVAGCTSGGSAPDDSNPETTPDHTAGSNADPDFEGWFDGVSNYEGVVDRTGRTDVTIGVGVEANGGALGFGPAAVRVDPETTVTWEWSGEGGMHNVAAEDGAFESELTTQAGYTFERTFSTSGTTRYACTPHESLGMKGAIVVAGESR